MGCRIEAQCLPAGLCRDRRNDRVMIWILLMDDRDFSVPTRRDIEQLLFRVPGQCVDTLPIGDGGHDRARRRIDDDRSLAATRKYPVCTAVVGNTGGPIALGYRPVR